MLAKTLHGRVGLELTKLQAITDSCVELSVILERIHSRKDLGTIHSIGDDLRKSSEDMRLALNRLSKFLIDKAVPFEHCRKSPKNRALDQRITATLKEMSGVRSELAQSQARLTEREDQIAVLIDRGLSVAFKKEALEEEIAELRISAARRASITSSP